MIVPLLICMALLTIAIVASWIFWRMVIIDEVFVIAIHGENFAKLRSGDYGILCNIVPVVKPQPFPSIEMWQIVANPGIAQ